MYVCLLGLVTHSIMLTFSLTTVEVCNLQIYVNILWNELFHNLCYYVYRDLRDILVYFYIVAQVDSLDTN
jgi:hypothetical protein